MPAVGEVFWGMEEGVKDMLVRGMILMVAIVAMGCAGRVPENLGMQNGMLAPCPDKPNCVSSFSEDPSHHVAAIAIADSALATWRGLQLILASDPRAEIVVSSNRYLRAVYTSALMRYRDDVEFLLREGAAEIAIRSASRVGHSDMGVNRERIEELRRQLVDMGLGQAVGSK